LRYDSAAPIATEKKAEKSMPQRLIEGYQRFRKGYFQQHEQHLSALAEEQKPSIAMVSCSDSRVDPAIIFDTNPGELFVIRNVANLVPPCEDDGNYHGTSAALEFAVTGLEVEHIVVLGHAQCGGIKALIDTEPEDAGESFVATWMQILKDVRQEVLAGVEEKSSEQCARACEKAAVHKSLNNLMSFPWISARVEAGQLALHGWYYDVRCGQLEQLETVDSNQS